jgi:hypothetical protein
MHDHSVSAARRHDDTQLSAPALPGKHDQAGNTEMSA